MQAHDAIVFDLDGTLWDTCESCALGWNAICARLGIAFRIIHAEDVRRVMGKPHEICIRETFQGLSEEQLRVLTELTMTEDNLMVQRHGGTLYQDVVSGLRKLKTAYGLFIVSNCQSGYIETFLSFAEVADCFIDFECWGNTRKPKSENLASLIERNALRSPVMIGDTESDQLAATRCGIPFFHVTYGFGSVTACDRAFSSFGELTEQFATGSLA